MGSILFLLDSCHFAVININFYIPQRIVEVVTGNFRGAEWRQRWLERREARPIRGRIRACRKQSTARCPMENIPSWAPRTPSPPALRPLASFSSSAFSLLLKRMDGQHRSPASASTLGHLVEMSDHWKPQGWVGAGCEGPSTLTQASSFVHAPSKGPPEK